MAVNSSNINTLSGRITMDVDLPGSNVVTDITSIGDITYEFDLIPTETVSTFIGGIPGACTVQVRNTMSNRGSLYDALSAYLGGYNVSGSQRVPQSNVNIRLVDRANTANTYIFPFTLKAQDIELDERSDIATLKLSPKTTNMNVNTWISARLPIVNQSPSIILPYNFAALSRFETNNNTVPVGDFIYDVVGMLGGSSAYTNIYDTAENVITMPEVTGAKYGTRTNVICDAFPRQARLNTLGNGSIIPSYMFNGTLSASFVYNNDRQVMEFVQMFSGMEGAIFGSAFSVNFYVNRTRTDKNVTLSKSDLVDLKFVSVPRSYNSVAYQIGGKTKSADGIEWADANINFIAWPDATQQAKVAFTTFNPYLVFGCFEGDATAQYGYSFISNSGPITSNFNLLNIYQDALMTKSFSSFASPIGAAAAYKSTLRIEFDVLGINKLRPWQTVKFDTSVPARYQNIHFRPTSIAYDLKGDRIKVTAYQVTNFEPVIPPPPPAVIITSYENIADFSTPFGACAIHPGDVSFYGNSDVFANSTQFYTDSGGTIPFNGGNQYYSDGTHVHQISTLGLSLSVSVC